jgi:hypothetical protein
MFKLFIFLVCFTCLLFRIDDKANWIFVHLFPGEFHLFQFVGYQYVIHLFDLEDILNKLNTFTMDNYRR